MQPFCTNAFEMFVKETDKATFDSYAVNGNQWSSSRFQIVAEGHMLKVAKYEDALNQSDIDAVMKLYAVDGVFMPQNSPSSVGADAVRNGV
jgi:hypothetical protein